MTPMVEAFLRSRGGVASSPIVTYATGAGGASAVFIGEWRRKPTPLSVASLALIHQSIAEHERGEGTPLSLDDLETDDG
ncbi:MAG TPA: hypothetical protein VK636_04185 [Gemmatimonadaceae bacterium]|nr:hypothetical protein [Gemmatimonadaceae bacterium]